MLSLGSPIHMGPIVSCDVLEVVGLGFPTRCFFCRNKDFCMGYASCWYAVIFVGILVTHVSSFVSTPIILSE